MFGFQVNIYARFEGRVLLINHKLSSWTPVVGPIYYGESPSQAALRELESELGWVPTTDFEFTPTSEGPPGLLTYEEVGNSWSFIFAVEGKTSFVACEGDVYTAHGWFPTVQDLPGETNPRVKAMVRRLLG